jgi:hypothetical protein
MRAPLRGASTLAFLAVLLLPAMPAAAQNTGKVEGRVTDQASGAPLAGAQVIVVGTRYGNVTNEQGYYFINNVPAGLHDFQAQYIGYQSVNLLGQRVLAGQTTTLDFALPASAIMLAPLEIIGETRPLVPRDQVGSKNIVTGETVQELPVDDVRGVLRLQPGVVESGIYKGISIRGGRSGEEAVYVDGVLVRNFNAGRSELTLGTNTLNQLDVLTGGFSAEFGEAQSGIINYVTRSGGLAWTGALNLQTDELAPKEWSLGFNRAELSVGGPVWGPLSFFGAFTGQGQRSMNAGRGWRDVPVYLASGVDTVVTITQRSGSEGQEDLREVAIPNYVLYDQGGQIPFSNRDEYTLDTKVDFSYGMGSRAFVSVKQSRLQRRSAFGGGAISTLYNPISFSGNRTKARVGMIGVTHNFFARAEEALALDVKFALARDEFISGVLDPDWEVDHRWPSFGFTFQDFRFLVDNNSYPVNQELVNNFLNNTGRRTPFQIGRTDLRAAQEFRLNPYGVATGMTLSGISTNAYGYALEERWQLRAVLDWQANRFHRFRFGGEYIDIDVADTFTPYENQGFADVWVENPKRASFFAQDRIDVGDVVLEAGVRWDRFNPNTDFPIVAGYYLPDDPSTYSRVDPTNTLSPRLGVSFPVTENSTFRLSYGHFVQLPDLNEYYQGKNLDYFRFRNTNTNDIWGRPLEPGRTIAFEFGYRQLLAEDFVLDISAYNKDKMADVAVRKLAWEDPTNPGSIHYLNTITNADFGTIRGIDLRMDRRFGRLLEMMFGYSWQDARGTGSDPYTYTRLFARLEGNANQLLGLPPNPAQAVRPIEENRRHNFTGNFMLNVPADHENAVLRQLGVFGTFRFASGLPYTRLTNVGQQIATGPPSGVFEGALRDQDINTGTMPWVREFDLKVTRGLPLGRVNARAFADIRNLFDFENRSGVFLTTGDVVDQQVYDERVRSHQRTLGGGEIRNIDLSSRSAAGSGVATDVDLVALQRAEERFRVGTADGIFSIEEQDRAFRAFTLLQNGPQYLIDPGRRLRIGVEVTF